MADCLKQILSKERKWVDCGKCQFCERKKRRAWSFRLMQELVHEPVAQFVTLTYAPEFLPRVARHPDSGVLSVRDHQLFMKRLRKVAPGSRFFMRAEYGKRGRPHYHYILYGVGLTKPQYQEIWGKGFVDVGTVTAKSVNYVTGYCLKKAMRKGPEGFPPFTLMSRGGRKSGAGGIGHRYMTKEMVAWHREDLRTYVVLPGGIKQALPRYYKDRIFDDEMKEAILDRILGLEDQKREEYWKEIWRLESLGHKDGVKEFFARRRYENELSLRHALVESLLDLETIPDG